MRIIFGIFFLLHGLVHLWFVVLSRDWVEFQSEMAWTGKSWLLSKTFGDDVTSITATILYSLAAASYVIASIGFLSIQEWTRSWMVLASIISITSILLFWDGSIDMLVEKGIIGFLISLAILLFFVINN
jgi:hypothetical protein